MTEDLDRLDKLCIEKFNLPIHYSCTGNIAQAWELLEKFLDLDNSGPGLDYYSDDKEWFCNLGDTTHGARHIGCAETAPLAIVKACLKAVGEEV